MRAKTSGYPSGPVVAFGGYEYVAYEWRDVPLGSESQAESHPYLVIESVPVAQPETKKEPAKPAAKPRAATRRRRTPSKETNK